MRNSKHSPLLTDYSPHIFAHWKIDAVSEEVKADASVIEYLADVSGKGNHLYAVAALSAAFSDVAGRGTFASGDRFMLKHRLEGQLGAFRGGVKPSFILSARINTTGTANASVIGNVGSIGGYDGIDMRMTGAGKLALSYNTTGGTTANEATGAINDGADHHIISCVDRETGEDRRIVRYDGDIVNQFDNTLGGQFVNDCPTLIAEEPAMSIGSLGGRSATLPFIGQVWDVQVYIKYGGIGATLRETLFATLATEGSYLTKDDWS